MNWDTFDAKDFYEELGSKYPEAKVVYSTLEGRLRRDFVRRFLKAQSGILLDVGCNVGIHMEDYAGPKIGVDIAQSLLMIAHRRIPDAEFHAGSAESMEFLRDESVDVVLCTEVLEHLERPQSALAEFCRVLRPGGRSLVTTPNRLQSEQADWIESEILSDYGIEQQEYFHTAFTPEELRDLVAAAGLLVEDSGSFAREEIYCRSIAFPVFDLATRLNHRTLNSRKLDHLMRQAYFLFERGVFRAIAVTGFRRRLNARVPEGKFTYVIARKPTDSPAAGEHIEPADGR